MIDVVDWKLIGACNLRCLHCYGPPKNLTALPQNELFTLVDKFRELGAEWVVMTGGEPLLVPEIDTLLERIIESGAKVALSTNTSYFRRHQKGIERYVSSLNIPLDGSTPEIHAKSRQDERSYHSFFDVLRHYRDNPERKPELLRVGTVYSRANQGDFVELARALEPFVDVIDTWKVYELIDYEFQPDKRAEIVHAHGSFEREMGELMERTPLASKISLASASSRNKAYFMVNPKGLVVVPTDKDGVTYEIPVGDLLREPVETVVERWKKQVNQDHYFQNHAHYGKQEVRGSQNSGGIAYDNRYSGAGTASCWKDRIAS